MSAELLSKKRKRRCPIPFAICVLPGWVGEERGYTATSLPNQRAIIQSLLFSHAGMPATDHPDRKTNTNNNSTRTTNPVSDPSYKTVWPLVQWIIDVPRSIKGSCGTNHEPFVQQLRPSWFTTPLLRPQIQSLHTSPSLAITLSRLATKTVLVSTASSRRDPSNSKQMGFRRKGPN